MKLSTKDDLIQMYINKTETILDDYRVTSHLRHELHLLSQILGYRKTEGILRCQDCEEVFIADLAEPHIEADMEPDEADIPPVSTD